MSLSIHQPSSLRAPHLVAVPSPTRARAEALGDAAAAVALLQPLLADLVDLGSQVTQAHWTVRGQHFVAHHMLFDELADHLREWGEAIAGRCLLLGGTVRATARNAAQVSRLPEYPEDLSDANAHIAALIERYSLVSTYLRAAIEDLPSADGASLHVLTRTLRGLELDACKLDSHRE
jgi:starvation-inducible DNA-binding protein